MKLALVLLITYVVGTQAKVKLLLAVWRHGDRAPESPPFMSDPFNASFWPRGWNQLTNIGIKQAYSLGKFLKNRYNDSVLPRFDRHKIAIRSSDADRAIETAMAVTAGLFKPEGQEVWTDSAINVWQPIPVRTNGKPDPMLRPSKVNCPNYVKMVKEERKVLEEETIMAYRPQLDVLNRLTKQTFHFNNIKEAYNVILEHNNGFPLPSWAHEKVDNLTLLDVVREVRRLSRLQNFNSITKARYMGGTLINNWAEFVKNVSTNSTNRTAVLYSSHDGTLTSLLYGLRVSNDQLIPYTACVLLEVHEDDTVQMFLRNSTSENPIDVHRLIVPGCTEECPVDVFLKSVADVRIQSLEELYKECATPGTSNHAMEKLGYLTIGAFMTAAVFFRRF